MEPFGFSPFVLDIFIIITQIGSQLSRTLKLGIIYSLSSSFGMVGSVVPSVLLIGSVIFVSEPS